MSKKKNLNQSSLHGPAPLVLVRLELQNIRGFSSADISFDQNGKPRYKTLILGQNGHGKSTVLRAIAMGLCRKKHALALMSKLAGPMLRQNKKGVSERSGSIHVTLADPNNLNCRYHIKTSIIGEKDGTEDITQETEPAEDFPWSRIFVCGYGVNRGNDRYAPVEAYTAVNSVQSIFESGPFLYDPEAILVENGADKKWLHDVQIHLKTLFQLKSSYKINASARPVYVSGPWGSLPLKALGDGYRGTATWVLDFLARALLSQNDVSGNPYGGIVLVDEIDEHLHPRWQRSIINILARCFPKVQFIGTTHSPMTIMQCQPFEVINCHLANSKATVNQDLPDLEGKTVDQVLRGSWFGLPQTMAKHTEELLAEFRKAIEEKAPEEQIGNLRRQIRDEVGPMLATPLDELALEIAGAYRKQFRKNLSAEQRAELMERTLAQLHLRVQEA